MTYALLRQHRAPASRPGQAYARRPEGRARRRRRSPLNAWTHLAATYDGATLRLLRQRRPRCASLAVHRAR